MIRVRNVILLQNNKLFASKEFQGQNPCMYKAINCQVSLFTKSNLHLNNRLSIYIHCFREIVFLSCHQINLNANKK